MFYRFVFKNRHTGELRAAVSTAQNRAARSLGLVLVPHSRIRGRQVIAAPWMAWECWTSPDVCLWHYTDQGDRKPGARK